MEFGISADRGQLSCCRKSRDTPLRDVLVLIENNRITQVAQQEEIPPGATVVDASQKWAGVSDRLGTLEAGKLADMLILEEDPLVNIRNTRKVVKIILGGRVLEPLEVAE